MNNLINNALNAVLPIYKKRIFEDGLDSNGQLIGTYDAVYKEYRQKKGLKANKVVLTNTGNLKKSIVVENNKIGFKEPKQAEIASLLEKKYGVPIFRFTKQESEFIFKYIANGFNQ